ncbi:hypothetical protein GYMLUDRAFT_77823 [Collybiopsis luxurians FD-317 M1]|uniref:Uncharacterized protein n=1 Tax=Collybiopsis luxurians FD-317 M1 TaxID=944289 RepID=A0A0D0CBX1_9AGAR|nr:hypothetical protein GYMLUDRAFT_77823 [Collybiopsis luxurians FD-317 M1]
MRANLISSFLTLSLVSAVCAALRQTEIDLGRRFNELDGPTNRFSRRLITVVTVTFTSGTASRSRDPSPSQLAARLAAQNLIEETAAALKSKGEIQAALWTAEFENDIEITSAEGDEIRFTIKAPLKECGEAPSRRRGLKISGIGSSKGCRGIAVIGERRGVIVDKDDHTLYQQHST